VPRLCLFFSCVLVGFVFGPPALGQTDAPLVRIVSPVDEQQVVTLKNTVHPLANAANDQGALHDDQPLGRIHLLLSRSAAQEAALRQLLQEQQSPDSVSYHRWLTPQEFGERFGPSDEDIATVTRWLSSHGFSVQGATPGKQAIEFTGTAGQFRNTFHAPLHHYQVNGRMHTSNASDPQIPAALAPVVAGFTSLNNFSPKPMSRRIGSAMYDTKTRLATPTPDWTDPQTAKQNLYPPTPADYGVQYDLNPVWAAGITGQQQTIAIINAANIDVALANQFRSIFGLPYNPPRIVIDGNDPGIDGANNSDGRNFFSAESYVDVEWAGAFAPNASIELVIAADTALQSGLWLAAEHAVYYNVAPVMSMSFGLCEATSNNAFIGQLLEQAAAQGITVLVSSGDSGSDTCERGYQFASEGVSVNSLASTPFNVAVGGTDFYYSNYSQGQGSPALNAEIASYWNATPSNFPAPSILKPVPEQVWNNSQYGLNVIPGTTANQNAAVNSSGGGGASIIWPKPAWQTGPGVPNDGARDLPDISLFAAGSSNLSFSLVCSAPGDCYQPAAGQPMQVSANAGTSFAAPMFAGIMALINQKYGPQGQANAVLYPLAAQYPQAFHDVTAGSNTMPCDFTDATPDCIAVANPIIYYGYLTGGELGSGTTPWYNAGPGYDLATGLGSIDANVLIANWNKVKFASTATTMQLSATKFPHGTPVTATGAVTATGGGTPGGSVALMTDSSSPGNASETVFGLTGGLYSGSLTALPGGTYDIWANYGGDTTNAPSASAKTQVTVSPEPSTFGDPGPPFPPLPYGSAIVFDWRPLGTAYYQQCISNPTPPSSCSATPTPATGSITVFDNGTAIADPPLNLNGVAESNGTFAVGNHSIVAKYSGDNSYAPTSSSPIVFAITKTSPYVQISQLIPGPTFFSAIAGEIIPFAVTTTNPQCGYYPFSTTSFCAAGAVPTGTITLTGLPGDAVNRAALTAMFDLYTLAPEGAANFVFPADTPPGTYNINYSYSGDANYAPASGFLATWSVRPGNGLPSTIAASISGALSPNSPGITINGTVTGQPAQPAPTGTINLYGNGSQIFPNGTLTAGLGDSSTFSLIFSPSFFSSLVQNGTLQLSVQYTGDSVYNPSAAILSSTVLNNDIADFLMQSPTPQIPIFAGGSGTATIDLTSEFGFSGNLTLSCQPSPGVTCSIPPPSFLTSGSSSSALLTIGVPGNSANMNYNVGVTATDANGSHIHTIAVIAQVSGSPAGAQSFALTSGVANISITNGLKGYNTISVYGLGGYSGTINLSCQVTGFAIHPVTPTCSLLNSSVTISGANPQTATVNFFTAVASGENRQRYPFWPASGGVALGMLIVMVVPGRRRWGALLCLFVVLATVELSGCGSTSSGGSFNPGTTPGGYTVTVTGTAGTITQTTSFTMEVTQ